MLESLASRAANLSRAAALVAQAPIEVRLALSELADDLRIMALASDKAAIVAKLDCLTDDSQIVIASEKIDFVLECAKLSKEPVRAAALLDRQGYWQHDQVARPNLWQDLARTYGPALNDPSLPESAVIAGSLLNKDFDFDADIFVPDQQERDKVLTVLERWGYSIQSQGPRDVVAVYQVHSDGESMKLFLEIVVTPLASDPPRLVRRFDAACCELWTRRSLGDYVMASTSAVLAIATRVLPWGRSGPLSRARAEHLAEKGYRCCERFAHDVPSCASPLVHHASEHYCIPPEDIWHKLRFASQKLESEKLDLNPDDFPLVWTDYLDVVASDEGRTLVLRPRPDQEADLLRHGVRCDRIWGLGPLSLPGPATRMKLQVRLLLALADVPRDFEESQPRPVQREFKVIYYTERHVGSDTLVTI